MRSMVITSSYFLHVIIIVYNLLENMQYMYQLYPFAKQALYQLYLVVKHASTLQ